MDISSKNECDCRSDWLTDCRWSRYCYGLVKPWENCATSMSLSSLNFFLAAGRSEPRCECSWPTPNDERLAPLPFLAMLRLSSFWLSWLARERTLCSLPDCFAFYAFLLCWKLASAVLWGNSGLVPSPIMSCFQFLKYCSVNLCLPGNRLFATFPYLVESCSLATGSSQLSRTKTCEFFELPETAWLFAMLRYLIEEFIPCECESSIRIAICLALLFGCSTPPNAAGVVLSAFLRPMFLNGLMFELAFLYG